MSSFQAYHLLVESAHLVIIASLGGFILGAFKICEYMGRAQEDKVAKTRACARYTLLFICLGVLGAVVSSIYIIAGESMGAIVAFQIGLTSPAIIGSMISAVANNEAKKPVVIQEGA